MGAVYIASPHPVPQRIVETRRIRRADFAVEVDQLVAKAVTDNRGLIVGLAADIHLSARHAAQHALVLLHPTRKHRAEGQAAQRQPADLEKVSPCYLVHILIITDPRRRINN